MRTRFEYKHFILLAAWLLSFLSVIGQNDIKGKGNNAIRKKLDKAQSYIANNQEENAIPFLNSILEAKPTHREALLLRAKAFNNLQLFDKALVDYNGLAEIIPNNPEIFYARGVTRYQMEQFHLAIEDFMQVLALPGAETQTAFFKMDPATNSSIEISTMSTIKSDVWNYIGLCYLKVGKHDKALNAFNEGLRLSANSSDLYVNRGLTHEKIGMMENAWKDYNSALSIDPANQRASYNALRIKMGYDEESNMIEALSSFISENPELGEGYSARGLHYYGLGKYNLALEDFEKAMEFDADNVEYKFNLALCMEKVNRPNESELLFLSIIETDPTHSGAYFNLGNLKYKLGQYNDAINYYTLAYHHNTDNILILYNRGLAYHKIGQNKKACQDMNKVMIDDSRLAGDFYSKHCQEIE